jgi:dihydrofolate reductase
MRKLVLSMAVTADGFINGAEGQFIGPAWSADLDGWTDELVARFDTLVYGRVSWEQMAEYWPPTLRNPDLPPATRRLSDFMHASRKLLVSRTRTDASAWANTTIVADGFADVIRAEKQRPGRDLVLFAGARLAQSALREGVVDELSLLVLPHLAGHGSRLFDGHGASRPLQLLSHRAMDTGAVLLRYAVA